MKTISLSVYNRPDALFKMLESLRRNNCEGYTLIISLEPSSVSERVLDTIYKMTPCPIQLNRHYNRIGLSLNTFLAPALTFAAGSDFNVYLEDDLILSPDALDLSNWYYNEQISDRQDSSVGLVLWRSEKSAWPDEVSQSCVSSKGQGGHGNGFACTRYQWETYWRKEWFSYGTEGPGHQWDLSTDERLRELGKHVLSPLYPRSVQQNIKGTSGKEGSINPLVTVPIYDGPAVKQFKIV